jgi:hypothetical protein
VGILATVLRRFDDADAYFASALEIHKRIEAPFHSARTQLEWARMLFTRNCPGDLDRATQLLATARKLARRYGCALVEQRTEALLGRSQESGTASTEHIHRVQPLMTTRRVSWEAPGRVGIVSEGDPVAALLENAFAYVAVCLEVC